MKTMGEQLCLMPAACAKCEELFDASHDFREKEEITDREVLRERTKLFCWECR
ncbi:MAG TPA: hypothetical protein VI544_02400 [Candidatus Nanoarchaeia archaeon]|nr:hypothetical protein [Candidatus Nanoarchaeia archaeon]